MPGRLPHGPVQVGEPDGYLPDALGPVLPGDPDDRLPLSVVGALTLTVPVRSPPVRSRERRAARSSRRYSGPS